jgi:hypothetical protein
MIDRVPSKIWETKAHYYQRKYLALCERLATLGLSHLTQPKQKEKENAEIRDYCTQETRDGHRAN